MVVATATVDNASTGQVELGGVICVKYPIVAGELRDVRRGLGSQIAIARVGGLNQRIQLKWGSPTNCTERLATSTGRHWER